MIHLEGRIAVEAALAAGRRRVDVVLIDEGKHAEKLDPLSLMILADAGWVYYLARQYDRTIELNRKAIDLDPNFWISHRDLGLGYERVGRFAEAVASIQKARPTITSSVSVP